MLSTTEAEYISLSTATQEAIWLRRLIESSGLETSGPTTIFEDKKGAIALSKNQTSHSQTKHIDKKYHFVRDAVEKKQINPSEEMIADILTKGLPKEKFEKSQNLMGLILND